MMIQPVSNQSFKSNGSAMREADAIVRIVNSSFPRISISRVADFENIKHKSGLKERLSSLTNDYMRKLKSELYDNAFTFMSKIRAFIEPVLIYKLGNCGESAQLSAITAKVNNIKNATLAHVIDSNEKDLDHAVLFVYDEKPYIIDAWLGFADYVPNALTKYKTIYKKHFDFEKINEFEENTDITFASYFDEEYTDFLKEDFSPSRIEEILAEYPQLKLKKDSIIPQKKQHSNENSWWKKWNIKRN